MAVLPQDECGRSVPCKFWDGAGAFPVIEGIGDDCMPKLVQASGSPMRAAARLNACKPSTP